MLSTKYLVESINDIPEVWAFEHYCSLSEKLTGQDIKIKSIFNANDKTPSMCIFTKDSKYFFKDFSTGKGGTCVKLVQEIYGEDYYKARLRIIEDYNKYVLLNNGEQHKLTEFKVQSRYKVVSHIVRNWNSQDKFFWQSYGISSKLLEKYNVKPLASYRMEKTQDGELKSLEIKGPYLYGYFTSEGALYKIYQPKVKEYKFIKIHTHLQGLDQLKGEPYLIIASSLKDALVIKSANLRVDVIAPDSENTMIRKEAIEFFQEKYEKILTLFDNDEAGIAAMQKYKEQYDIDYVYFNLEKDVADAVKAHGQAKTFSKLIPAINKKLN